ncbi:MAG: hypothetical protein MUF18_05830 [Fimbriiglobus sp.]|jgi:hypothetical protein|nr:hypothetical protein [Fimbriiglobus sp.]
MPRVFALLLFTCGFTPLMPTRANDPKQENDAPVRVTVVVVLATTENNVVDKKLTDLATEVQKRYPELVGFKFGDTVQKSIAVGGSHTFSLLEEQSLKVTIDAAKDKNGRVGLTVVPPGGNEVSYTCVCDKFFPLMTAYKTKDGRKLILAIGAKPCTGKGP